LKIEITIPQNPQRIAQKKTSTLQLLELHNQASPNPKGQNTTTGTKQPDLGKRTSYCREGTKR